MEEARAASRVYALIVLLVSAVYLEASHSLGSAVLASLVESRYWSTVAVGYAPHLPS